MFKNSRFFIGFLFSLGAVHSLSASSRNLEIEYYSGGVFDEKMSPSGDVYPKRYVERKDDILFDESGNSNQLIILLDGAYLSENNSLFSGGGNDFEKFIIKEINGGNDFGGYFGEVKSAHFLIERGGYEEYSANHQLTDLDRFIVFKYSSVAQSLRALDQLNKGFGVRSVGIDKKVSFSWSPNDSYFAVSPLGVERYQWGLHTMSFPLAWDETQGHGYVGIVDGGIRLSSGKAVHNDLKKNYRGQFSRVEFPTSLSTKFHGEHVAGIIAASTNNGIGIAGACPNCSFAMVETESSQESAIISGTNYLIENGVQVINYSLGIDNNCNNSAGTISAWCAVVDKAGQHDILVVAASGNYSKSYRFFPANHTDVLPVAGIKSDGTAWRYSTADGTNYAGLNGVSAPAKSIVSTVPNGVIFNGYEHAKCSDGDHGVDEKGKTLYRDESGIVGDGYGSCTGTSMAAPHVSALGGMLRSINPRLSKDTIKTIIRNSGTLANSPTAMLGSGIPRANIAVTQAISQTPNRLTPLFSLYSDNRLDFFYTTVPQMAYSAIWGNLKPANTPGFNSRYIPSQGNTLSGYTSFGPNSYNSTLTRPQAAVWVFSTPKNPKNLNAPLAPLYRLSWKCGDSVPQAAVCISNPNATDTTYTTDVAGVSSYEGIGYKLDGIEGYIYPKNLPQPAGTVRLMRKYNPARDDHAIFPESQLSSMAALGYTADSGSDWLGYVYLNSNGAVPSIL